jgi:TonB family protein
MLFSRQSNRPKIIEFALILSAVATTHIAVLQSAWESRLDKKTQPKHPSFIETFSVQTTHDISEATIAQDIAEKITTIVNPTTAPTGSRQSPIERNNASREKTSTRISMSQPSSSVQKIIPPVTHASFLNNPPPPYPRQSRRLGEQGRVVLAVEIDINGAASQAMVSMSSGYPRLDRTALETVLKWRFIAGNNDGVPQKMWVTIPINFILE